MSLNEIVKSIETYEANLDYLPQPIKVYEQGEPLYTEHKLSFYLHE